LQPKDKIRIVTVMPHGPAYHYHPGGLPEVFWQKADGGIVGFWSNEWMDVLGAEVLKTTDRYCWEVCQPDERADRIYSKQLDTGVVHRLYPAASKTHGTWPFAARGIDSPRLIADLVGLDGQRAIVMVYGTFGFRLPFYADILRAMRKVLNIPVFIRSGGMFKAPFSEFFALHRPLTYLQLLAEHLQMKRLLRRADVISEPSAAALGEVRKIYGGRIERLTMGCDFSFWTPVPSRSEKEKARQALNIGAGKTVFFASGNFVPRKQMDNLVEVFVSINGRKDFFLLIAGQGEGGQHEKLCRLAAPLVAQGCALVHPYAVGEQLRRLYWAADVYVSVATDEGGPASVMKALACALPVVYTPVGETAETLKDNDAGCLVDVSDYNGWKRQIQAILAGRLPAVLERATAQERYHWPMVVERYVRLFESLARQHLKD